MLGRDDEPQIYLVLANHIGDSDTLREAIAVQVAVLGRNEHANAADGQRGTAACSGAAQPLTVHL